MPNHLDGYICVLCVYIFALRNIALGGYLDTRRNIKNIYGMTFGLKHIYTCVYIYILVGCKHRASEVLLYIGGRGLVCQIIEPVTFARCAFIIALQNIALDGYLDTRRNI